MDKQRGFTLIELRRY
ncbi:MAG: prepilin-type N-terminal cleavage/methylation domain-containing protein [Planctomycetota bacterium]